MYYGMPVNVRLKECTMNKHLIIEEHFFVMLLFDKFMLSMNTHVSMPIIKYVQFIKVQLYLYDIV